MSETELSVICKNCGSEVSPYVTECPYCGARLRKRAPKLERRGDALEAQRAAPAPPRCCRAAAAAVRLRRTPTAPTRPWPSILGSAILLLVQKATGDALSTFGGADRPDRGRVVALPDRALRLRRRRLPVRRRARPGDLRDRGRAPARHDRRPRSCCSPAARWGCSPRPASPTPAARSTVIAGGNGMALGARRRLVRDPPRRSARGDRRGVRPDRRRRRRRGPARAAALRPDRRRLRRPRRRRRRRPRRAAAAAAAPRRVAPRPI